MITEFILIIIALGALYSWWNSRSPKKLPPGPSPFFPILGNIPQLIKYKAEASYETFDKLVEVYGPVVYIRFGAISQVVVQDLALAKEVLSSDVWVDRVFDEYIGERSWGKSLGIIFSWGEVWKEMRRFSMRTLRDFGFGRIQSMESVIDDEITLVLSSLENVTSSKKEMSMRQFFTVSILNILWSMVAGFRFSHEDVKLKKLINLIDETSKNNPAKAGIVQAFPFLFRFVKNSHRANRRRIFIEEMQNFFREILDERRKSGSYKEDTPKDFIDVFLQEIDAHKNDDSLTNLYTDEQFIMVLYDLFVAGAETTSNTLEFAMLYMVLHPEVQTKVQEEIDRVVGKSRRVTLEDKSKMPYTEATLLEIQRVANVLPVVIRGCNQDTNIAGYHIPKGTLAGISSISLHNSKAIWSDPDKFQPERFLDEDKTNIVNANKILPFGHGKRVCLGEALARASLFSYFASILQRFSLTPSPEHPRPSKVPVNGFTLSPQEYFVILKQR
ncbi:methyl farnesoate epoxidase [Folsomia candida]|uniref:methyl farnesoate epoxidase n=1 Tax=Folsomia candida TaxID=158441 RepID=UPI000B9065DB|nr:methyl farnesoate epoxidase [Folsomia candida]